MQHDENSIFLQYTFGAARVTYREVNGKLYPVGFEDWYDFDPRPWGERSKSAETVTRFYYIFRPWVSKPFRVYY